MLPMIAAVHYKNNKSAIYKAGVYYEIKEIFENIGKMEHFLE